MTLERTNTLPEEDIEEGLDELGDQGEPLQGPIIPDDVRKRLLDSWKLEE